MTSNELTISAAVLHLLLEISSIVPCSSGKSRFWLCRVTGVTDRMALTSASLFLLPVMKLSSFGAILSDQRMPGRIKCEQVSESAWDVEMSGREVWFPSTLRMKEISLLSLHTHVIGCNTTRYLGTCICNEQKNWTWVTWSSREYGTVSRRLGISEVASHEVENENLSLRQYNVHD